MRMKKSGKGHAVAVGRQNQRESLQAKRERARQAFGHSWAWLHEVACPQQTERQVMGEIKRWQRERANG